MSWSAFQLVFMGAAATLLLGVLGYTMSSIGSSIGSSAGGKARRAGRLRR